jgi:hypothetical protein
MLSVHCSVYSTRTGVLLVLCSSNCIMRLGRIFPGVLAARYHLVNVEIVCRVSRPASKSVALQRWHQLTLGPLHRVGALLPWSDRPRRRAACSIPHGFSHINPDRAGTRTCTASGQRQIRSRAARDIQHCFARDNRGQCYAGSLFRRTRLCIPTAKPPTPPHTRNRDGNGSHRLGSVATQINFGHL